MSSDIEIATFIGLDWADQQHVIRLRAAGSAPVEAQVLDQKPESLRAWIGQLRQRFGGRPVAIALEQSRGSLLYALMNVDFLLLYPVNPHFPLDFLPQRSLPQHRKRVGGEGTNGAIVDPGLQSDAPMGLYKEEAASCRFTNVQSPASLFKEEQTVSSSFSSSSSAFRRGRERVRRRGRFQAILRRRSGAFQKLQ